MTDFTNDKRYLKSYPNRNDRKNVIESISNKDRANTLKNSLSNKKPIALLTYFVLLNHSSINNKLKRQDIVNYIKDDYGIEIKCKDSITNSINEMRPITEDELKDNKDYYLYDNENKSLKEGIVVTCGKSGYYLLKNSSYFSNEEFFLLVSMLLSNQKNNFYNLSDLLKKIASLTSNFSNIDLVNKISKEFFEDTFKNTNDKNYIQNSEDSKLFNAISCILKAKYEKLEISFQHVYKAYSFKRGEINDYDYGVSMHPLYLFIHNGNYYVIGISSTNNEGFEDYFNNEERRLLYVANLKNIYDIKVIEGSKTRSFSEEKLNSLKESFIKSLKKAGGICEGYFYEDKLRVYKKDVFYAYYSDKDKVNVLKDYFGNNNVSDGQTINLGYYEKTIVSKIVADLNEVLNFIVEKQTFDMKILHVNLGYDIDTGLKKKEIGLLSIMKREKMLKGNKYDEEIAYVFRSNDSLHRYYISPSVPVIKEDFHSHKRNELISLLKELD